jgi:arginase
MSATPPHTHLIAVPFDSGRRGERMGAGPLRLLDAGLASRLEAAGHTVNVTVVDTTAGLWPAEIAAAFDLATQVAALVRAAIDTGAAPLVLSGNCGPAALGCVSGARAVKHVFWFDAHGDFNTPETTIGGFLDGMAIATLTGGCWRELAARIPGFRALREDAVTLIGARDLDPLEADALTRSRLTRVSAESVKHGTTAFGSAVEGEPCYVHLDLDVLDLSLGRVNNYAADGGLTVDDVRKTLGRIARGSRIAAASVTSFDPHADSSGRALTCALDLAVHLAGLLQGAEA